MADGVFFQGCTEESGMSWTRLCPGQSSSHPRRPHATVLHAVLQNPKCLQILLKDIMLAGCHPVLSPLREFQTLKSAQCNNYLLGICGALQAAQRRPRPSAAQHEGNHCPSESTGPQWCEHKPARSKEQWLMVPPRHFPQQQQTRSLCQVANTEHFLSSP